MHEWQKSSKIKGSSSHNTFSDFTVRWKINSTHPQTCITHSMFLSGLICRQNYFSQVISSLRECPYIKTQTDLTLSLFFSKDALLWGAVVGGLSVIIVLCVAVAVWWVSQRCSQIFTHTKKNNQLINQLKQFCFWENRVKGFYLVSQLFNFALGPLVFCSQAATLHAKLVITLDADSVRKLRCLFLKIKSGWFCVERRRKAQGWFVKCV